MNWLTSVALTGLLVPACAKRRDRFLYDWDDRRILCSVSFDDDSLDLSHLRVRMRRAHDSDSVVMIHAHAPGSSVSLATLEQVLDLADEYQLGYVTYDELLPSPQRRAAIAISFDDSDIASWYSVRDLLARHHARVSLFVTRAAELDAGQIELLRELAAAGNAIEAHSVGHYHAREYVRDHGVDSYVADEAGRSIIDLRRLGFAPTSYAYPYGENVPAVDRALIGSYVERIRVGPGACQNQ